MPIVNCKKTDNYDVYIARPSEWGSPFKIGIDGTRKEVIAKYRVWLLQQPHLMAKIADLHGKTLGCWCRPYFCHGDVLLEIAEQEYKKRTYKVKTYNYHDLLEILKSNNDYCVEVTANDRYYHKISYIEYFCCGDIDQYPSLTLEKYERNDVMPSVVYSNKLKDDIIGVFPNDDLNQDVRFYNPDNDDWYFIKNVSINKDDKKLVITIASTSDIQHSMFTIIKEEK